MVLRRRRWLNFSESFWLINGERLDFSYENCVWRIFKTSSVKRQLAYFGRLLDDMTMTFPV